AVPGMLTIRKKRGDLDMALEHYATFGGVVEINGESVRILVDEVEHADELYEEEIRKALERAEKLKKEAKTAVELEKAQALMDRQFIRLKVAEIRRHKRRV
ncbi:MAG: synthase epsilon chain, partial [Candidatus Saccharibacteria bacterium]|nr:synthase epsilon chain [Candidatus Saccharibacteria bacterium]